MVFEWLKRPFAPASGTARRPAPRRIAPRLELEQLEDRTVPSAIRMLPGFTTNNLPANDDNSTGAVNLGFNINFFGVNTSQVFVNNNGNITIGQPSSTFTPGFLNTANGGIPIIAPFYADVDTRGAGSGLTTYGTDTLCGEQAFGVDWFNVGYFDQHVDKLNTFQLILVARPDVGPGDFDIEFNYQQIQWETGDASGGTNGLGGTSAAVGYSNGSGTAGTNFQLPGSLVNGALIDGGPDALVSNDLLATTPGRYHFLVRNGQVITAPPPAPTTNDNVSSMTRFFDPFRFITDDLTTGEQHGNLTLVNIGSQVTTPTTPTGIDACLDIPDTTTTTTTTNSTTFASPITIVFENLPSNVTIANATGTTASGKQYITIPVNGGVPPSDVLRVALDITNSNQPAPDAPSTFFGDQIQFQTYAGTFDPTQL